MKKALNSRLDCEEARELPDAQKKSEHTTTLGQVRKGLKISP